MKKLPEVIMVSGKDVRQYSKRMIIQTCEEYFGAKYFSRDYSSWDPYYFPNLKLSNSSGSGEEIVITGTKTGSRWAKNKDEEFVAISFSNLLIKPIKPSRFLKQLWDKTISFKEERL